MTHLPGAVARTQLREQREGVSCIQKAAASQVTFVGGTSNPGHSLGLSSAESCLARSLVPLSRGSCQPAPPALDTCTEGVHPGHTEARGGCLTRLSAQQYLRSACCVPGCAGRGDQRLRSLPSWWDVLEGGRPAGHRPVSCLGTREVRPAWKEKESEQRLREARVSGGCRGSCGPGESRAGPGSSCGDLGSQRAVAEPEGPGRRQPGQEACSRRTGPRLGRVGAMAGVTRTGWSCLLPRTALWLCGDRGRSPSRGATEGVEVGGKVPEPGSPLEGTSDSSMEPPQEHALSRPLSTCTEGVHHTSVHKHTHTCTRSPTFTRTHALTPPPRPILVTHSHTCSHTCAVLLGIPRDACGTPGPQLVAPSLPDGENRGSQRGRDPPTVTREERPGQWDLARRQSGASGVPARGFPAPSFN